MTLHEARIEAMKILYTLDMNNSLDEKNVESEDKVAKELAINTIKEVQKIDFIISVCLKNYTLNRLNLVDKAIVRLATCELLMGTDKKIVINEALELTKEYSDQGDHKAVSFNNRLLDTISVRMKDLI
jgi:N utilization substance protein B